MLEDRFKLKIWDKEQNKFFSFDDFKKFEVEFNFDPTTDEVVCEYDKNKYTVIQCTGFKDKNGKLIYEGDVVSVEVKSQDWLYYETYLSTYKCKIIFEKGEFEIDVVDITRHPISLFYNLKNCEVIGNIYENPELLDEINN